MSNPFEPWPHRPKASPNNARLPIARLRAAGAPPGVIEEAERRWAGASAEERAQAKELFDAATDDELAEGIVELEFALAARSAGAEDDDTAFPTETLAEAEANAGTVAGALEWAGEDPDRALAMLVCERRRADTERRKTLLHPLEARVRGDHDDH